MAILACALAVAASATIELARQDGLLCGGPLLRWNRPGGLASGVGVHRRLARWPLAFVLAFAFAFAFSAICGDGTSNSRGISCPLCLLLLLLLAFPVLVVLVADRGCGATDLLGGELEARGDGVEVGVLVEVVDLRVDDGPQVLESTLP